MAEAFVNYYAKLQNLPIRGESAGTEAGTQINPQAIEVMHELGISMRGQVPKQLTQEMADDADKKITMGCGVDATSCPARIFFTEDWGLDDPKGQSIEKVREIRDQIDLRVKEMLREYREYEGEYKPEYKAKKYKPEYEAKKYKPEYEAKI